MILHLISSQTVIAKIIADLDISEDNIRVSDMIEWVGEAIGKIGGIQEMSPQITVLPICNNQVRIPCDSNNITQVAYSKTKNGPWHPTRKATGSFVINQKNEISDHTVSEADYIKVYMDINHKLNLTYDEARAILNSDDKARDTVKGILGETNTIARNRMQVNFGRGVQYFIKPGYLVINMDSGFVKLAYNSLPRDEFGYPMVPDKESYIEAIYWYVVTKLIYPEFLKGKISMDRYGHAEMQYTMYSRRAYGELKSPNLDELKSIMNSWNRMYPVLDEHDTFYSNVGDQEIIYNHS